MTETPSQPALGQALRSERRRRRMSLRDLADEIDVSFNTLSRVERGHLPDLTNYNRIVTWLSQPGLTLLGGNEASGSSTPELVAKQLYTDPRLKPEHANEIMSLVQAMYEQLAAPKPSFAVHLRSGQTFLPEAAGLLSAALTEMHSALLEENN